MPRLSYLSVLAYLCLWPLSVSGFCQSVFDDTQRFSLVSIGDQFPIALLHSSLRPREAQVLPTDTFRFRSSLAWSNTANRKRGHYLVDAETRVFEFELETTVAKNFEIGLRLPLIYRGGGVLDRPIYRWHEIFGLPQETRDDDDVGDDEHRIGGRNEDGSRYDLRREGTYFGDITLSGQYQIIEESDSLPALSIRTEFQLPTSAEEYGQDKVDLQVAILSAKGSAQWRFYGGAAYLHSLDTRESGLSFMRHRASAFLASRYVFWRKNAVSFTLLGSSQLISQASLFPKYSIYVDLAYQRVLSPRFTFEFLLRENPAPDEGTSDVSFLLALKSLY